MEPPGHVIYERSRDNTPTGLRRHDSHTTTDDDDDENEDYHSAIDDVHSNNDNNNTTGIDITKPPAQGPATTSQSMQQLQQPSEADEEPSIVATAIPILMTNDNIHPFHNTATTATTAATTNVDDDVNHSSSSTLRSSVTTATELYQQQVRNSNHELLTYKHQVLSSRFVHVIPTPSTTTSTTNTDHMEDTSTADLAAVATLSLQEPLLETSDNDHDHINNSNNTNHQKPSAVVKRQQEYHLGQDKNRSHQDVINGLIERFGFTTGLAQIITETVQKKFTKFYWVIDNSGSMLQTDCSRIVSSDVLDIGGSSTHKIDIVKCSRWKELEATILQHSELAGLLHASTTFHFVNDPKTKHANMAEFTISNEHDVPIAYQVMEQMKPEGATPIIDHINDIYDRISLSAEELKQNGQKHVVVIATDGLPSDAYGESSKQLQEEFTNALKKLQLLPVWIVIRLCTNQRDVMHYYRKLDKKLELSIECISDYIIESKEIRKFNPWLNYALPLHQCREMGFHHRVFDLLDERIFTKDDLMEFLIVLFGNETFQYAPDIHTDWVGFLSYLKTIVSSIDKQWNPCSHKMEDWIDIKRLASAFGIMGNLRRNLSEKMNNNR